MALRWLARGQGEKPRLLLPIELSVVLSVGWASVYGCLKAFLKVLLAHPTDGRLAYLHGLRDRIVNPARTLCALVGLEQDASVSELSGRGSAGRDQALELISFGMCEDNGILLLHDGRSIPTMSLINHNKCRHTLLA